MFERDLEAGTDERELRVALMNHHAETWARMAEDERALDGEVPGSELDFLRGRGVFGIWIRGELVEVEAHAVEIALRLQDLRGDSRHEAVVALERVVVGLEGLNAEGGAAETLVASYRDPDASGTVFVATLLGDEERLVAVAVLGARAAVVVELYVR